MALLETIADGQLRVENLRDELGKVRHALDNTDAVLGVADEGLEIAEEVIEEAKRIMPVIVAVTVVVTAGTIALYLWSKRGRRHSPQPQQAQGL